MLNRVDIKDAVNPSQKILAQLGLTPVLSNPFNHLMVMARIKKNIATGETSQAITSLTILTFITR